jgi:predicted nucleic acid-binding protein
MSTFRRLSLVGRRTILAMARDRRFRLDVSPAIIKELVTVLREDFHWNGYRLHFMRRSIEALANVVLPEIAIELATDLDDNRILECAVAAKSRFIVTSDRHLLRLDNCGDTLIIPPHEFLALDLKD